EVNTFTEIRIENVPEVVNAGYVIDPDSLLVTALYSNGSEIAVDINDVYLDIPDLEKAGIYILTANYRGKTAKAVVLADIVGDSIELYSGPDKTLYYVGEMFNPEGISVKYMTVNGNTVLVTDDIDVETRLFEAAGDYEIAVTYAGYEFKVAVAVIPAEYKLLNGNSDWTLDTDAKRLHGVPEFTTVADIIAGFKSEVAVFDRTGKNITASAEAYVGTGYTVATLMDGEIADYATVIVKGDVNGNGKIDTNDYILIKRAYLGLINVPAGSDTSYAADVNGNGMIDTNDYIRVKNHYRGLLDLFN
ncbi:MAG: bacterial Ig-like domain-containing protein, partial [Clostridia bacterium]|nr:bacterial Ig-like domain-containing protein [Clostridia bacterium]